MSQLKNFASFFLYLLQITNLPIYLHSLLYEFFAIFSTILRITKLFKITMITNVNRLRLHIKHLCFALDLMYFAISRIIASPELLILGGIHQLHHLVDRATRYYLTLGQLNAIVSLRSFLSLHFRLFSLFSGTFLTSLSLYI